MIGSATIIDLTLLGTLSAQEMRGKFVDCARRVIDEAAIQNVVEYVERLETLKDVGDLCALLAGEKR
jgi:hypothetical protein